jgi:diguanylate cyclase (GGDEF)-like protein/PAS domain S-box-containing protein
MRRRLSIMRRRVVEPLRRRGDGVRRSLPDGRCAEMAWTRRHRAVLAVIWVHVAGLALYASASGRSVERSLAETALLAAMAIAASQPFGGRTLRSVVAAAGLMTSSALFVHFSNGLPEAHLHFLVMVAILSLYRDWVPFLVALVAVLLHYGALGAIDPAAVYGQRDALDHPWRSALIDGGFILAAVAANIWSWRTSEHDHRRAQAELRASEARLRTIIDTSLNAVVTMDGNGVITGWSPQAEQTFGWSLEEAVGRPLSSTIVPPRYREAHIQGLRRFLMTGEGPVLGKVVDISAIHRDGREFPVELAISPAVRSDDGLTFIAFIRDASARKKAEAVRAMQFAVTRALSESSTMEDAAPRVLETIAGALDLQVGAIWTVDHAADALVLRHRWRAASVVSAEFEEASRGVRMAPGVGLPGRVWQTRAPLSLADVTEDSNFPRVQAARAIGLHGGVGFPILVDEVVTGVVEFFSHEIRELESDLLEVMADLGRQLGQFIERRRAEAALRETVQRLAEIAATDSLTGLKNRRDFERLLSTVPREQFAVLAIDVDELKHVNDEYGHEAGDVVLRAVAMTLSALVRGWDVVARVGGDEFAIILPGVTGQEAAAVAERMRVAMHSVSVPYGRARVSIGWAAGPAGADPRAVRQAADHMLLSAKREGRDRVAGGDQWIGVAPGSADQQGAELVSQVLDGQATLGAVYQPIVHLEQGRIIGYEALARPAGFDPTSSVEAIFAAARRLGRMRDLDWLCRRTAIDGARALPDDALLFINVSGAALLDPVHGVDQLLLLLQWAGRHAERTVLEITEQEVIRDLARLKFVLAAHREHGIRFALDDVGQGYSTLELLAASNPEFVKISGSLITTLARQESRSAVQAAVAFARSSGATVVAEGIESEAVADQVGELGIPLGQGYWLGKPARVEAVPPELHRRVSRTRELP